MLTVSIWCTSFNLVYKFQFGVQVSVCS